MPAQQGAEVIPGRARGRNNPHGRSGTRCGSQGHIDQAAFADLARANSFQIVGASCNDIAFLAEPGAAIITPQQENLAPVRLDDVRDALRRLRVGEGASVAYSRTCSITRSRIISRMPRCSRRAR